MSGVNKVILVGRLGADPEVKTLDGGNTVATMSLATSENWKDKDGNKQERTEWHRCVAWNKTAELIGKYLTKGRQVYVEGTLQTRSYEDQQGVKKYTTEVVVRVVQFLGSKDEGGSRPPSPGASDAPPNYGPAPTTDEDETL